MVPGRGLRHAAILAAVLSAAGCAARAGAREEGPSSAYPPPPPGAIPGLHGDLAFTIHSRAADGRVAAEGSEESASGSPRSGGFGLSLDALGEPWSGFFETSTTSLPEALDLDRVGFLTTSSTEYHHLDFALGVRVLQVAAPEEAPPPGRPPRRPLLRIDPSVGIRRHTFVVRDDFLGVFPGEGHGDRWLDSFAGLRVESQAMGSLALRVRADTLLAGESDHAWRASAALVLFSGSTRLALGWECLSVDFESGSGPDLVRYDVFLTGPFVSLELRF